MKLAMYRAVMMLLVFTILTGVLYPVAVLAVARGLFPNQAQGSLIQQNNRVVGSELIGQPFDELDYFWGRPSATPGHPYNAAASNGSNLGPMNPALRDAVVERIRRLREIDPGAVGAIPVDLVTTSASGLDPHISPASAYFQVSRIARLRHIDARRVRSLVDEHVEQPVLGVLGERRVNVLRLNLALDRLTKSEASRDAR